MRDGADLALDEAFAAIVLYTEMMMGSFDYQEALKRSQSLLENDPLEMVASEELPAYLLGALLAGFARAAIRQFGELRLVQKYLTHATHLLGYIDGAPEQAEVQARLMVALGEMSLVAGDTKSSRRHLVDALPYLEVQPEGMDRLRFDRHCALAVVNFREKAWGAALDEWEFAAEIAHKHDSPIEALAGHLPAAAICAILGQAAAGQRHMGMAMAVLETVSAPELPLFYACDMPFNFAQAATLGDAISRGRQFAAAAAQAKRPVDLALLTLILAALHHYDGNLAGAHAMLHSTAEKLGQQEGRLREHAEILVAAAKEWPRQRPH